MSTTLTIAKREFRSNFDSPLAYVVICLGLIMLGLIFFFLNGGFWQADRATLASLFYWIPKGLSFLIVPVVTMRLLAEEKRSGTLEMLITLPVRDHEVVLGKYIGALGLVLIIVAATIFYPLFMFWGWWHLGSLDSGPVFAGYLGLVLYAAATVSIGLLVSSLTESQVISFFVTWAILIALVMVGQLGEAMPAGWVRSVSAFVSLDARLASFARGLINTRDVIYFLSVTILCLMASFRALERRKWA
jgi:ABC-2 type transport system permease protein